MSHRLTNRKWMYSAFGLTFLKLLATFAWFFYPRVTKSPSAVASVPMGRFTLIACLMRVCKISAPYAVALSAVAEMTIL